MTEQDKHFMRKAIELAKKGMLAEKGGPFGAVVVKNGKIVGQGCNSVTSTNDPTAHAEVMAIRDACNNLESFQLEDCIIYTSCEPCPMCLGAIYWARPKQVFYACSREDAANVGFDDAFIYDEIPKDIAQRQIETLQILREEANRVFEDWEEFGAKVPY